MTTLDVLAWTAWGLALVSVWGYGQTKVFGGLIGVACATAFVTLGSATSDWPMVSVNTIFAFLHLNNVLKD